MSTLLTDKKPIIQMENYLDKKIEIYLCSQQRISGVLLDCDVINNIIIKDAKVDDEKEICKLIFVKCYNIESVMLLDSD